MAEHVRGFLTVLSIWVLAMLVIWGLDWIYCRRGSDNEGKCRDTRSKK